MGLGCGDIWGRWMMITWQRYYLKNHMSLTNYWFFWWHFSLSEYCIYEINVFFLFNSGPLSGYKKVPKSHSHRCQGLLLLMVRAGGKVTLLRLVLGCWSTEAFSNEAVGCVRERAGEGEGCYILTESHGLSSGSCSLTAPAGLGTELQGKSLKTHGLR